MCLYTTWTVSACLFVTESRVLFADWLILEKIEQADLHIEILDYMGSGSQECSGQMSENFIITTFSFDKLVDRVSLK